MKRQKTLWEWYHSIHFSTKAIIAFAIVYFSLQSLL